VWAVPEPPKATWRTTFGSERKKAERAQSTGTLAVDADIVLLQGVTDVAALRRVFPAWHWRLVISRRILDAQAGRNRAEKPPPSAPVTAIAVRSRVGLRITAKDELRVLSDVDAIAAGTLTSAAIAVRIQAGERTLWLISVVLADVCADTAACLGRTYVADWRQSKRAAGEATVAGGRLKVGANRTLPPPPCARHALEADPELSQGPPPPGESKPIKQSACLAVIDVAL
jgi:hypothetical protein